MNSPFNLRYWLLASRSAHANGGLRDFVGAYDTMTHCIQALMNHQKEAYCGWWQIYDSATMQLIDSKDVFREREVFQQKQLERIDD